MHDFPLSRLECHELSCKCVLAGNSNLSTSNYQKHLEEENSSKQQAALHYWWWLLISMQKVTVHKSRLLCHNVFTRFFGCHANNASGGKFKLDQNTNHKKSGKQQHFTIMVTMRSRLSCHHVFTRFLVSQHTILCCFLVAVRAPIDSLLGLCVAPSFKS